MRNTISRRGRVLFAALAVLALGLASADARPSGGGSFGSRGGRTFSAPPSTSTAPSAAAPIQRSITQPGMPGSFAQNPAAAAQPRRGLFSGFGGGLMAGLLGAGLFGMLFGGGFLSGLGGLMSFFGLLLQVALIGGLVMLALRFFRNRSTPAMAAAGPVQRSALGPMDGGLGGASTSPGAAPQAMAAQPSDHVGIREQDYAAFERLLTDINAAWDAENEGQLRRYTTPEMAAYFGEDLAKNAAKGWHDRVKDVKLLQGDLAEAWSEGSTDYATVAMRFSLVNAKFDRASGRVIEGDATVPQEATEIWTFRRERGGSWVLSAIQQAA
jgi:predicted lipid-binding transport protein (Tim44 family)